MKRPLRILFVNRMASMERGGGETFDLEIARHLAAMGHQITILSGIPLFGRARLPISSTFGNRHSAIGIAHIRAPMFPWFPWDRVKGGWRVRVAEFWLFEKRAAHWAWKHREQFDVIQVCELPTFVSAFKSKIGRQSAIPPIILRLTAPDFHDPSGGVPIADAVVASGDTMRHIREGARPDCHDIPNGVDVERFCVPDAEARSRSRSALALSSDALVVTHVARFQSVKNHALLIDAFGKLVSAVPNARLLLAGSGPMRPAIEKHVRRLSVEDHVRFLGEVRHADLPAIYAAADINVMPSDYESFCFAVLEGMACGLPHAVTDTNWVPGLLGKDAGQRVMGEVRESAVAEVPGGLVTPVGDVGAFADALVKLARDPDKRSRMGGWNRERVERDFTWDASAAKLLNVYRTVTTADGTE